MEFCEEAAIRLQFLFELNPKCTCIFSNVALKADIFSSMYQRSARQLAWSETQTKFSFIIRGSASDFFFFCRVWPGSRLTFPPLLIRALPDFFFWPVELLDFITCPVGLGPNFQLFFLYWPDFLILNISAQRTQFSTYVLNLCFAYIILFICVIVMPLVQIDKKIQEVCPNTSISFYILLFTYLVRNLSQSGPIKTWTC